MSESCSELVTKLMEHIIKFIKILSKDNKLARPDLFDFSTFSGYTKTHKALLSIINSAAQCYDIHFPDNYIKIRNYIMFGIQDYQEYMSCSANIHFALMLQNTDSISWADYIYVCNKTYIDAMILSNEKTECTCCSEPHYKYFNHSTCEKGTEVKEVYTKSLYLMLDIYEKFNPGDYIARRYKMINGRHESEYPEGTYSEDELKMFPCYDDLSDCSRDIKRLKLDKKRPIKIGYLYVSENSAFVVL